MRKKRKKRKKREVSSILLDNIFLNFGTPHVLQSDSGREFPANIIKELVSLWPNLILINDRQCKL